MTPDDLTQPIRQQSAPYAAWPTPAAQRPPQSWQPRRSGRGRLWAVMGFVVGGLLAALITLALVAPPPAPNAAAQTSGTALTVTMTDTLLTQAFSGSAQGGGVATLSQARAHIQANGQIVISGVLQSAQLGAGSPVTLIAQPYVSNGVLAVKFLRVSIGGIALPTATLNTVRDQINQQLAKSSHISLGVGQALSVSGVSFADGKMTLTYAPASA